MRYLHYALSSVMRKMKKSKVTPSYLDFYKNSMKFTKPTICLTHDLDEGYEPNLDLIVDLEKKYNVKFVAVFITV